MFIKTEHTLYRTSLVLYNSILQVNKYARERSDRSNNFAFKDIGICIQEYLICEGANRLTEKIIFFALFKLRVLAYFKGQPKTNLSFSKLLHIASKTKFTMKIMRRERSNQERFFVVDFIMLKL